MTKQVFSFTGETEKVVICQIYVYKEEQCLCIWKAAWDCETAQNFTLCIFIQKLFLRLVALGKENKLFCVLFCKTNIKRPIQKIVLNHLLNFIHIIADLMQCYEEIISPMTSHSHWLSVHQKKTLPIFLYDRKTCCSNAFAVEKTEDFWRLSRGETKLKCISLDHWLIRERIQLKSNLNFFHCLPK